ncbi:MAG TPA: hypothetical protein VF212_12175 [Longimicrobiales bacterium]
MPRYELQYGTRPDYGKSYGPDYVERERFEPEPRPGRTRGRARVGRRPWTMRRAEPAYGPEFVGRQRMEYGREYTGRERPYYRGAGYGREYMGYGLGYGAYGEYGEEYGAGYGREFEKSRWEVDYGDPFRDRVRGTPTRMVRGEYGAYGEEFIGRPRGRRYGRTAGMGYATEYRPRRRYRY